MKLENVLKVLEILIQLARDTDTISPDGDLISTTYMFRVTVPAGQPLTFSIPLNRDWLCIFDWVDVDFDGVGSCQVEYYRDFVKYYTIDRPIRIPAINVMALQSVDLKLINNDTVDHNFSIMWHYCLAKADKYSGFITGVGSYLNEVVKEVAIHGMPKE